jgi:hypothetical protein
MWNVIRVELAATPKVRTPPKLSVSAISQKEGAFLTLGTNWEHTTTTFTLHVTPKRVEVLGTIAATLSTPFTFKSVLDERFITSLFRRMLGNQF